MKAKRGILPTQVMSILLLRVVPYYPAKREEFTVALDGYEILFEISLSASLKQNFKFWMVKQKNSEFTHYPENIRKNRNPEVELCLN